MLILCLRNLYWNGDMSLLGLQRIIYTPKGRAWNYASPTLGGTQNAAFLSLVYSKFLRQQRQANQLQKRYVCWSRGQLRYVLGDADRSFVVGYGVNPPLRAQNQGASCSPSSCDEVSVARALLRGSMEQVSPCSRAFSSLGVRTLHASLRGHVMSLQDRSPCGFSSWHVPRMACLLACKC